MQIPVMNGIYTNGSSDFRTSYPVNLIPVPKENGISNGYLRPADGIDLFSETDGIDRGGINWNGVCYRVIGSNLVSVDNVGNITIIGDVGAGSQCSFDYSFDYLIIVSNRKLYLYDGSTLTRVTDSDLGSPLDVMFIDGYIMTTDGTYLVVNELTDPFQVDALKYGSAESDPDPILALKKVSNEVYAVGRYTVEVFDNVGGEGFPFQRIDGAMIPKGTIGTYCCCKFLDVIAFVGSGKNEPVSVYIGTNGQAQKIATREIDQILLLYPESVLSNCLVEARTQNSHQWLYIHLPDQTLVYDYAASSATGQQVWFFLSSGITKSQYQAKNHVWCYDKWIVGHPSEQKLGLLVYNHSHHYSNVVGWEFGTTIVYNESKGAIFNSIELICLSGHVEFGTQTTISTEYSVDGELWSQPRFINSGTSGNRVKRLVWFWQGHMKSWRIQKFKGTSNSYLSIARLEATLEPLAV